MSGDLRECCQTALIDGLTLADHFPDCDAHKDDPPTDALFPLPGQPTTGGQQT